MRPYDWLRGGNITFQDSDFYQFRDLDVVAKYQFFKFSIYSQVAFFHLKLLKFTTGEGGYKTNHFLDFLIGLIS